MTNPRYAFLKLDAPICSPIRMGIPDLTATDVLLACQDLPRSRFLFALYAWASDDTNRQELVRLALLEAVDLEDVRRRHAAMRSQDKKGAIQGIIVAALHEHRHADVCPKCNGMGERLVNDKNMVCLKCGGKGRDEEDSSYRRAQFLGMNRGTYARYWKDSYESIFFMFNDWGREVIKHMVLKGY